MQDLGALDLNSVSSEELDSDLDAGSDARNDLAESITAKLRDRDQHLVRRASTRLDFHAIRSAGSMHSITDMLADLAPSGGGDDVNRGDGLPLAVDTTHSLAPLPGWPSRRGSDQFANFRLVPPRGYSSASLSAEDSSGADLERTLRRSKDKSPPDDLESSQRSRGSFSPLSGNTGRSSIRRTMSMAVQGSGSESKSTERYMRIAYNLLVLVLVFCALFMEALGVILWPPSTERFMIVSAWVVFTIFLLELIIFSALLPGYWRSEQFWMELIAVVSLLPITGHLVADCSTIFAPFDHSSDCRCAPWVLMTAQTTNSIVQPIRAAAMRLKGCTLPRHTLAASCEHPRRAAHSHAQR